MTPEPCGASCESAEDATAEARLQTVSQECRCLVSINGAVAYVWSYTRERWAHKLWIFENVDDRSGAVRKIMAPREGESLVVLCGTMFGLPIWRHRLFLANFPLRQPASRGAGKYRSQGCRHETCPPDPITGNPRPWGIYHVAGDSVPSGGRTCRDAEHAREVMGSHRLLPWDSLKEGFPPAYTSHIGADLLVHLALREAGLTAQEVAA